MEDAVVGWALGCMIGGEPDSAVISGRTTRLHEAAGVGLTQGTG